MNFHGYKIPFKPLQIQGLSCFPPRRKHGAQKEIVSGGCILYASARRGYPPRRSRSLRPTVVVGIALRAIRAPTPCGHKEKPGMGTLSTAPFRAAKKTERKVSKGKDKETRPGCFSIPLRPRGRAKVGGDVLGGNKGNDRGTWGYYCYHHDIETILEKAREIASRHRQGELKWPIRAFQRWLQRSYGRVGQ